MAGLAETTRTDLAIDGMTCGACASGIQREIAEMDGVQRAQVNFATGKATIIHDPSLAQGDFQAAVEGLGYELIDFDAGDAAQARRETDLRRRLVFAATLTVLAMLISMLEPLHIDGWEWVVAALTTPVVFWSGWPFHRAAVRNLVHGSMTMDTLVSIGSTASWLWSTVVLVGQIDGGHLYFETGAMIVTLILLGKYIEVRAKRRSGDAIRALVDLGAQTASLEDGTEIEIDRLTVGTRFVVRPGEKVATDGVIVDGHSAIDASMVTGEPIPVEVGPGDEVIGATINANGSIVVEATHVGADTTLSQIIRLVDEAQGRPANVQRLADRASAVFVPLAVAASLATLVAWLLANQPANEAFTASVAVLIIACPCALGLATPLAIMVGTGRGAQLGVLIKGGDVLEDTRTLDVVVLDKTGTVTEGRMTVIEVIAPDGRDSDGRDAALLVAAASLEARSEHPIAAAIAAASPERLPVDEFVNLPGIGVRGLVDGIEVRVGQSRLFDDIPPAVAEATASAGHAGSTVVLAGRRGMAEAVLVLTDRIKDTSPDAVAALHRQGLSVVLLTGDNARTAQTVGDAVGVDAVIAEVLPSEKVTEVQRLQAEGRRVAMVGDGINDAPALAQADLGIAVGTGTDVAIEASDLTVVTGDLRAVADAIALSRRTLGTIKGNLFWAFAYNAAAMPLAALGVLNPMMAAGAMGLSSLFVVSNSLRLRRFVGYRTT